MLKKWALIVLIAVGLVCGSQADVLADSDDDDDGPPIYLSLGTSLAACVQYNPLIGRAYISPVSYPSELAELIRREFPRLDHENFGCPYETAETFINGGGICTYSEGSQLDQAVRFLQENADSTVLVTIDIGANDILQCVDGAEVDFGCFFRTVDQLSMDLAYILQRLHAVPVDDDDISFVGMNYYNPLLAAWFTVPGDPLPVLEMLADLQWIFNTTLESVYAAYGVPVADVAGAFMSYDVTTDENGNMVPDSVATLCAWTWMCPFEDIHANDIGYGVIADQFYNVIEDDMDDFEGDDGDDDDDKEDDDD